MSGERDGRQDKEAIGTDWTTETLCFMLRNVNLDPVHDEMSRLV